MAVDNSDSVNRWSSDLRSSFLLSYDPEEPFSAQDDYHSL